MTWCPLLRSALVTMTAVLSAVAADVLPAADTAVAVATVPPPVFNSGDTAWVLISAVLVLFMTIPGLALFYGGLVRTKNVLTIFCSSLAENNDLSLLFMACPRPCDLV